MNIYYHPKYSLITKPNQKGFNEDEIEETTMELREMKLGNWIDKTCVKLILKIIKVLDKLILVEVKDLNFLF